MNRSEFVNTILNRRSNFMQEDMKKLTEEEILKMIRVTIKQNTGIDRKSVV